MIIEVLIFCFVNVFVFFFGCMIADLVSQEIKMCKLNKKIKACRDSELDATTEKIKGVDNESN